MNNRPPRTGSPLRRLTFSTGIVLLAACSPSPEIFTGYDPDLTIQGELIEPLPSEIETGAAAVTTGDVSQDSPLPPENAGGDEPAAPPPPIVTADGWKELTFDYLASWEYQLPEDMTQPVPGEAEGASERIPEDIRELDRQDVAIKGFMLPLKVEEGKVTEFLIMRDQSMCCYGTVPRINEWISVRMEKQGVRAIMDEAVTMFGKLRVGEFREDGYLVGIYEMDGDRMTGPEE